MLGESWKRPSIAVAAWSALLVAAFVANGNLRIGPRQDTQPVKPAALSAAAPAAPVVVKAEHRASVDRRAVHLVRGRVFDALGHLVAGAQVLVDGAEPGHSDDRGVFAFELRDGQFANVEVRAEGHCPTRVVTSPTSPDPLLVRLTPAAPWDDELPAAAPAPRLFGEGIVLAANGNPVAGASVTAAGSDMWSETDQIGRYVLPLRASEVTIVVHGPADPKTGQRLAARTDKIELSRDRGHVPLPEIVAEPGGSIRGVVRDGSGVPLAGVPVRLSGEGLERVTESGSGGRFDVGGLLAGNYVVRPFAFEGALGSPQPVMLDRPVVECDLHLMPTEQRRLRILDEQGVPVAHAYVAPRLAGERTSVARADADGWAEVHVAEAVEFEVRAGEDHLPAAVRSFDPAAATLVVALR
jgi:protocatechuate 3,4-dioxygenase beta subunit